MATTVRDQCRSAAVSAITGLHPDFMNVSPSPPHEQVRLAVVAASAWVASLLVARPARIGQRSERRVLVVAAVLLIVPSLRLS